MYGLTICTYIMRDHGKDTETENVTKRGTNTEKKLLRKEKSRNSYITSRTRRSGGGSGSGNNNIQHGLAQTAMVSSHPIPPYSLSLSHAASLCLSVCRCWCAIVISSFLFLCLIFAVYSFKRIWALYIGKCLRGLNKNSVTHSVASKRRKSIEWHSFEIDVEVAKIQISIIRKIPSAMLIDFLWAARCRSISRDLQEDEWWQRNDNFLQYTDGVCLFNKNLFHFYKCKRKIRPHYVMVTILDQ